MIQIPSKEELSEFILPNSKVISPWYQAKENEHYRLISYLCDGMDLVFDIGTYQGFSALAMSTAKKVISYDVENQRIISTKNCEYKIGNVLKDKRLLKASVILIDTYHEGDFEAKVIEHLRANNYKGLLVMDDIYFNKQMTSLWESITEEKHDLTELGHYTGTGLVIWK
jgi:hypothetical protein